MEIKESYCVIPKSDDQLETELKQHNDSLIGLFYYARDLSELHSEARNLKNKIKHAIKHKTRNLKNKIKHPIKHKTRNLKKSYKTLVCDLAFIKWKLQKFPARNKLFSSSKEMSTRYFTVMKRISATREKLKEHNNSATVRSTGTSQESVMKTCSQK